MEIVNKTLTLQQGTRGSESRFYLKGKQAGKTLVNRAQSSKRLKNILILSRKLVKGEKNVDLCNLMYDYAKITLVIIETWD